MVDNTLSPIDKARLLAATDSRSDWSMNETLYQALKAMPEPEPDQLDGPTRRAITAFIRETWAGLVIAADRNNLHPAYMTMGAMTEMLITGYNLGRQLQKPLPTPVNSPLREGG